MFVSATSSLLLIKDRDWIGRDISVAYAVFASVSYILIGSLLLFFAAMIGSWILESVFRFRWATDQPKLRRFAWVVPVLAVVTGLVVLGVVFWLVKDVPVSSNSDDEGWPLPLFWR